MLMLWIHITNHSKKWLTYIEISINKIEYFVITGETTKAKRTKKKKNLSTFDVTSFLFVIFFFLFLSEIVTESIKETT